MTLHFSDDTYPHVLHWLEHVQENYYNDPQCHFQIPAKLSPRAVRDEGKPAENPKYPLINHLNANIQGLSDTSSNMRHEQYVRALMESADLMDHEHPFLAKLRKFARDRRRPLHRAWKMKPDGPRVGVVAIIYGEQEWPVWDSAISFTPELKNEKAPWHAYGELRLKFPLRETWKGNREYVCWYVTAAWHRACNHSHTPFLAEKHCKPTISPQNLAVPSDASRGLDAISNRFSTFRMGKTTESDGLETMMVTKISL